jgi:hypothetical protein
VAFSELIERGMIPPGTKLIFSKKRHGALVRADDAIMLGDKVGSILRIGAVAARPRQSTAACVWPAGRRWREMRLCPSPTQPA